MSILDRALGTARDAGRLGARVAGSALGKANDLRGGGEPKPDMDDVTLARKVETELFRDPDVPKGKIDINAVDGVVELRGEVRSAAAKKTIEAQVREIPEVVDVHNFLHQPKTTASTRADAPGRAKRRTPASKEGPRTTGGPVSEEGKTAMAEPSPVDLAAEGKGRQPAPLGAEGESDEADRAPDA